MKDRTQSAFAIEICLDVSDVYRCKGKKLINQDVRVFDFETSEIIMVNSRENKADPHGLNVYIHLTSRWEEFPGSRVKTFSV